MAKPSIPITGLPEADELLVTDPLALLIGMLLDQQVPMEWAFKGPWSLKDRLGGELDAGAIAAMGEDAVVEVFCAKPALHRYPAVMGRRTHELCQFLVDHYDGDAGRVWRDAPDADTLRANLGSLPGFGEMKVKSLGSVLAKQFGVEAAQDLVPWHPTLGDVDSPQALADYQAAKRIHKAEWQKARAGAA